VRQREGVDQSVNTHWLAGPLHEVQGYAMSEEHPMSWEQDAQDAFQQALKDARVENGNILIREVDYYEVPTDRVCHDRDSLVSTLYDIVINAWNGSVPFDGGWPACEFDESSIEEALEEKQWQALMKKAGWPCE